MTPVRPIACLVVIASVAFAQPPRPAPVGAAADCDRLWTPARMGTIVDGQKAVQRRPGLR